MCRQDVLWGLIGMVVEQLAFGLKKHEASLLQLEAVHAAGVAAIFDHWKKTHTMTS